MSVLNKETTYLLTVLIFCTNLHYLHCSSLQNGDE